INKIANPATSFVSLDKFSADTEGSLLFLDEVDGIFGNQDRGGIGAIIKIFKEEGRKKKRKGKKTQEPQIPVVLAANDPDLSKLRPLKKVCQLIRFRKVRIPRIVALLKKISLKEQIDVEFEALEEIAQNSEGDVRSAIVDLQALSEEGEVLRLQDTRRLSSRNRKLRLYDTLRGVFSAKSSGEARKLLDNTTVNYDDLMLSVQDNLPLRYKDPVELAAAYNLLSKADVFRGRVGTENWKLLKYFFNLLAQATTIKPQTFKPFEFISFPTRISTLFWTRGKRTTFKGICAKIGAKCHVSRRSAKIDFIPFIRAILKEQKSSPICTWLELDSKELDYLTSMEPL
ncbi:MAG: hypothetical protein JSW53_01615, partial [Candidatus Bathyarchaeota archaeon]